MAVPADFPPRIRARHALAQKLVEAGYERAAGLDKPALVRRALAACVADIYGDAVADGVGGLADWLPFTDAARVLDHNLSTACARGCLARYFAGQSVDGAASYVGIFASSTDNLFANLDQLTGADG